MGALIASSPVVIEQKDLDETVMNDRAREPVAQAARAVEIQLEAQVSWSKSQSKDFKFGGQGGQSTGARGYLVFSKKELTKKAVTLAKGDRVKTIAGIDVDVYLTEQFYAGHMKRKPRHEYWNFADKEPSKV